MKIIPPSGAPDPSWAGQVIDGLAKVRITELSYGTAVATFPGGVNFTTALQVTHGLSAQATRFGVFTQPQNLPAGCNSAPTSVIVAGATTQQFQIQWTTTDGVNPVLGSTVTFYWLAII